MRDDNIRIFNDTLEIIKTGEYKVNGKPKKLKLSRQEMEDIQVYLPDDIKRISDNKEFDHIHVLGRIGVGCENMDSYSLAIKRYKDCSYMFSEDSKPILVLNLANAVHPGGGVRKGAKAQEEDLCRKSSLILSLESDTARKYYNYNSNLHTRMGSDAVMITPKVEIIRDDKGNLLDDSVIVSVMTCAAPDLRFGKEGMNDQKYQELVYNRVAGMLKVAAHLGYTVLILGAFGCGAFDNDAHVVSDIFYKVLKEFDYDGMQAKDFFRRIDFAVMDHSKDQYNFKEFSRNFSDFYRKEDAEEFEEAMKSIKETEKNIDKIRGSLFGGAAGDALGYAIEFQPEEQIFSEYGPSGITEYELDEDTGKALISDDTQMTLFTANGILIGDTRICMRGIGAAPRAYVGECYLDWYKTQTETFEDVNKFDRFTKEGGKSWLLDIPELFHRRAPGKTCMTALQSEFQPSIEEPVNESKGCGGIMRVAPMGLRYRYGENTHADLAEIDLEGAEIAAITHGNSLGYMPAAVVTHIITRSLNSYPEMSLKDIIIEARDCVKELFANDKHIEELNNIINLAITLSENDDTDLNNIHKLGEGWVAEETLGIALYCSLRYENDFSKAIIAAVNHNGDSDSTGAVTGNIVGALVGYSNIDDKWKKNLELADIILEVADDLCHGCQMSEYGHYSDPAWASKYMYMHRYNAPIVPTYTFFWHEYEENGCFSNWYSSKFVVDDFEYLHMEQYLMAQKAKCFHDSKRYTEILRSNTPKECKDLGKLVKPFDVKAWNKVKYDIAKKGLRAKFEQNPKLKEALLDTGNSILAEASPYDRYWGIALDANAAKEIKPEDWPGENLLGKALMEIRAEFRNEEIDINKIYQTPIYYDINRMLMDGLV